MKNKKCKCGGKFQELSIYDDWDGKVTCNKCGIRVDSDPTTEPVKKKKMTEFPKKLRMIHEYTKEEKLWMLNHICHNIYIARNISMDHQVVLDNLGIIDSLYRTPSEGEEFED